MDAIMEPSDKDMEAKIQRYYKPWKTITARIEGEKWLYDTYLAGLLDLVLERNRVVGEDCLQDTAVEMKYK
jgi:hypothetical protein